MASSDEVRNALNWADTIDSDYYEQNTFEGGDLGDGFLAGLWNRGVGYKIVMAIIAVILILVIGSWIVKGVDFLVDMVHLGAKEMGISNLVHGDKK